jgi:hypothetical protein
MAFEEALRSITLEADSSIGIYTGVPGMPGSLSPNSAKQFRFVKVTASKTAGLAVEAGGTIAAGAGVKVDSTGRPVTWVGGTDAPNLRVGVAVLAGAVGQLISVLLLIK